MVVRPTGEGERGTWRQKTLRGARCMDRRSRARLGVCTAHTAWRRVPAVGVIPGSNV
jgi:hypothetical protein